MDFSESKIEGNQLGFFGTSFQARLFCEQNARNLQVQGACTLRFLVE